MRRLVNYLINNIREHLMLYLFLWGLLAISLGTISNYGPNLRVLFLVFRTDIN